MPSNKGDQILSCKPAWVWLSFKSKRFQNERRIFCLSSNWNGSFLWSCTFSTPVAPSNKFVTNQYESSDIVLKHCCFIHALNHHSVVLCTFRVIWKHCMRSSVSIHHHCFSKDNEVIKIRTEKRILKTIQHFKNEEKKSTNLDRINETQ